jgi:tetratricopeptide (TPR) repeat protein
MIKLTTGARNTPFLLPTKNFTKLCLLMVAITTSWPTFGQEKQGYDKYSKNYTYYYTKNGVDVYVRIPYYGESYSPGNGYWTADVVFWYPQNDAVDIRWDDVIWKCNGRPIGKSFVERDRSKAMAAGMFEFEVLGAYWERRASLVLDKSFSNNKSETYSCTGKMEIELVNLVVTKSKPYNPSPSQITEASTNQRQTQTDLNAKNQTGTEKTSYADIQEVKQAFAAALKLYATNRNEECIRIWDALLSKYPNLGVAYYNRAIANKFQGNAEQAQKDFQKASSLGVTW